MMFDAQPREERGEITIFGNPFHGLVHRPVAGGTPILDLPNGSTKTLTGKTLNGGDTHFVQVPGLGLPARSAADQARDATNGHQWLNYAVFSDVYKRPGQTFSNRAWLFIDGSGKPWAVYENLRRLYYRPFGVFGASQPAYVWTTIAGDTAELANAFFQNQNPTGSEVALYNDQGQGTIIRISVTEAGGVLTATATSTPRILVDTLTLISQTIDDTDLCNLGEGPLCADPRATNYVVDLVFETLEGVMWDRAGTEITVVQRMEARSTFAVDSFEMLDDSQCTMTYTQHREVVYKCGVRFNGTYVQPMTTRAVFRVTEDWDSSHPGQPELWTKTRTYSLTTDLSTLVVGPTILTNPGYSCPGMGVIDAAWFLNPWAFVPEFICLGGQYGGEQFHVGPTGIGRLADPSYTLPLGWPVARNYLYAIGYGSPANDTWYALAGFRTNNCVGAVSQCFAGGSSNLCAATSLNAGPVYAPEASDPSSATAAQEWVSYHPGDPQVVRSTINRVTWL